MPESWRGHYNAVREVDDSWYGRGTHTGPSMISNSLIERNLPDVSEHERRLVLSIMGKGFRYESDRITARQLLEDPEFIKLMEIYGCR
jgi:hypothetical protein